MISINGLMENSGVRFGTSGVRGLVTDLSDRVCWAYTMAFLQEVVPQAPVVAVGHDLRPSSPAITQACVAAIEAAGRQAVFAGALPTPALAYFSIQQGMPAVMVTGSHIPFDRNGIKFYTAAGEISKTDESVITSAHVVDSDIYSSSILQLSSVVLHGYLDRYRDFFPENFLVGRRIGLYEHSSVARDLLSDLLREFGAEVISLGRTDAFVPVDTEAVGEEDQAMAAAWSDKYQLDAILSTDGDGDRPLIADEHGHWLRGDIVGLLCARYLGARVVAIPISCNTAIERCGTFDLVERTRIGSPYVVAAMDGALAAGKKGVVGFEANGGFLIGSTFIKDERHLPPLPTRDAILPMLSLLAMAYERNQPLSALSMDLPQRFTVSNRIQNCPTENSHSMLLKLAERPDAITALLGDLCGTVIDLDQTDGLRITFENNEIVHLRPSGNAPELRCYAEAHSEHRAAFLVDKCLERVGQRLE